jgi:hypothetical protein
LVSILAPGKATGGRDEGISGGETILKGVLPNRLAVVRRFMVFDGSHPCVGALFVIGGEALLVSRLTKMEKTE